MISGAVLGRLSVGAVSDYLGVLNSMLLVIAYTIVVTFGLWFNTDTSSWKMYLLASMFGFGISSALSMTSTTVSIFSGADEFGVYYGTLLMSLGFA
jgi:hypothetical protein